MRRPRLLAFMLVVILGALGLLAGRATVRADAGGISAKPVSGKAVGHGLRLSVHVFYARGGNPGPPPGNGGGGGGGGSCPDTNDQTGWAAPFASSADSLHFEANASTSSDALTALQRAAHTWSVAAGSTVLSVDSGGTATGPSLDNENTVGWVRIVPKNVLAATWSWEDSNNKIVEADIFFNTSWSWATLAQGCTSSDFDIEEIATHEMGHALGLNHYSDADAQATMYPSAPAGEIRKRTLTAGDEAALAAALSG